MSTTQSLGIGIVATNDTGPAFASVQGSLKDILEATKRVKEISAPMERASKSTTQLAARVQNASFQIGDFAVQVGAGTSASVALAQQLPQLVSGFGVFGAVAGAAIAILLPLAQSLGKTRDYAKELADGVDKLEAAQKISTTTIVDLTEEYGRYASVISAVARTQEELAKGDIVRALVDQSKALSELNSTYVGTAGVFGEVVNQWKNADFGRSAFVQLFSPLDEAADKVNFLKDKFSLTEEAARGVAGPFNDFQLAVKNTNTEAAALALEQFSKWIIQNRDDAASAIPILDQMRGQFMALSKLTPLQKGSMGFSFTPTTQATGFSNYKGDAVVAGQLAAIEQRAADAKKAVADAARAAAAAQREQTSAYERFIGSIEKGTTPLQRLQDTLRQARDNFARFGERMMPEQVANYTAYIADLNAKIDELAFKEKWDAMAAGIQTVTDAMPSFLDAIADVGRGIEDSFVNGLSDAFTGFLNGTESAKEALKGFAATFMQEMSAMIVKALILYAVQRALGMAQGSMAFGSLMQSVGGVYGNGGIFSGGRPLTAFAGGGVVSSPTLFPMAAGGAGLMGEAGPEAIIPLSRRNGKLGVGASPVNVTVINNSGAQVNTRKGADGSIQIMVEEVVANALSRGGNKIDAAMTRGYGLRRAGR